jgi:hypothetical protein
MPGLAVVALVVAAIVLLVAMVLAPILLLVTMVLAPIFLVAATAALATATAALTNVTRPKARGNLRISIGHRLSLLVLRTYAPLPGAC